jgi:hypothetical protein
MVAALNLCPQCKLGIVSLRDERKCYGPETELGKSHRWIVPIAVDRTYTCDGCGYMIRKRDVA